MQKNSEQQWFEKAAIRELAERYARAVDRREFATLAELLTIDAEIISQGFHLTGRENIVSGMTEGLARFELTQHCIHNLLVTIQGDSASAETYCTAHHIYRREAGLYKLSWGIRYQDRLLKQQNNWYFRRRELVIDWQQDLAVTG